MRSQHRMPSTAPSACGKRVLQELGQRVELAVAHVAIEIREDVLDEDLAAELLAEKADVAADDRPEIEQHRRLARRQRGEKLAERLGGENGIVDGRDAEPCGRTSDSLLRGAMRSSRPIRTGRRQKDGTSAVEVRRSRSELPTSDV